MVIFLCFNSFAAHCNILRFCSISFRAQTKLGLFYFSLSHTMKTWAEYKTTETCSSSCWAARETEIQKIEFFFRKFLPKRASLAETNYGPFFFQARANRWAKNKQNRFFD